jgi:hypothetical protein
MRLFKQFVVPSSLKQIPFFCSAKVNECFKRKKPECINGSRDSTNILIKIAKLGQLQMGVESREPIMHSSFFRLKHSFTMAEQKKTPYRRFPMAHIL